MGKSLVPWKCWYACVSGADLSVWAQSKWAVSLRSGSGSGMLVLDLRREVYADEEVVA